MNTKLTSVLIAVGVVAFCLFFFRTSKPDIPGLERPTVNFKQFVSEESDKAGGLKNAPSRFKKEMSDDNNAKSENKRAPSFRRKTASPNPAKGNQRTVTKGNSKRPDYKRNDQRRRVGGVNLKKKQERETEPGTVYDEQYNGPSTDAGLSPNGQEMIEEEYQPVDEYPEDQGEEIQDDPSMQPIVE